MKQRATTSYLWSVCNVWGRMSMSVRINRNRNVRVLFIVVMSSFLRLDIRYVLLQTGLPILFDRRLLQQRNFSKLSSRVLDCSPPPRICGIRGSVTKQLNSDLKGTSENKSETRIERLVSILWLITCWYGQWKTIFSRGQTSGRL